MRRCERERERQRIKKRVDGCFADFGLFSSTILGLHIAEAVYVIDSIKDRIHTPKNVLKDLAAIQ